MKVSFKYNRLNVTDAVVNASEFLASFQCKVDLTLTRNRQFCHNTVL